MEREKRTAALIIDKCSAHHALLKPLRVEVLFLPPNTTPSLKPMNAGVTANFKGFYHRLVLDRLVLNMDREAATDGETPELKVTLVMAVQFICGAWWEVRSLTVKNRFRKVGIARGLVHDNGGTSEDPVDSAVVELWKSVPGDGSTLEDFLHVDNAFEMSECLTDEAIVRNV